MLSNQRVSYVSGSYISLLTSVWCLSRGHEPCYWHPWFGNMAATWLVKATNPENPLTYKHSCSASSRGIQMIDAPVQITPVWSSACKNCRYINHWDSTGYTIQEPLQRYELGQGLAAPRLRFEHRKTCWPQQRPKGSYAQYQQPQYAALRLLSPHCHGHSPHGQKVISRGSWRVRINPLLGGEPIKYCESTGFSIAEK